MKSDTYFKKLKTKGRSPFMGWMADFGWLISDNVLPKFQTSGYMIKIVDASSETPIDEHRVNQLKQYYKTIIKLKLNNPVMPLNTKDLI